MSKVIVSTKNAPQPNAPISQATVAGKTVYISGCLGLTLSGQLVSECVKEQTRAALCNLKNILVAAGSNVDNVLRTTIYLQDLNDFGAVNDLYKEVFARNFPARTCIQVAKLPFGGLVEIEAIALISDGPTNLNKNLNIQLNSKL